jgi:ABC-type Zn uptake system ZnuABC Zn-binding protein ZnuA
MFSEAQVVEENLAEVKEKVETLADSAKQELGVFKKISDFVSVHRRNENY